MRSWRLLEWATLVCASILLSGCDAMRITWQTVDVLVTDAQTNETLRGAELACTKACPQDERSNESKAARDAACLDRWCNATEMTNERGRASLRLEIGTIQGGFQRFDPNADRVTGTAYLFRVRHGDASEILNTEMFPGATVKGELFSVTIESIEKPRNPSE